MFTNRSRKVSPQSVFVHCHAPAIFERGNVAFRAEQGVVCALLYATALESLSHDLVAFYDQIKYRPIAYYPGDHAANNYMTDEETALLGGLKIAEKKRMSVLKKLAIMRGQDPEKGIDDPDLNLLILTRNRIAHLEPEATSLDAESSTVGGRPDVLSELSDKGLTRSLMHNEGWIEALETPEFCAWCKSTARAAIKDTLVKLPKTFNSVAFGRMLR